MTELRTPASQAAAAAIEPLVRARNVHKSFGDNEVLKGIDLDVHAGRGGGNSRPVRVGKVHLPALHQPSRGDRPGLDRGRRRTDRLRAQERKAAQASGAGDRRGSAARSAWCSSSSISTRT